ncbi:hypothetical protein BBFGKLBO_00635 [Synechococcus sp. CBW1107]|jgi:hypothetical protein|nr:hypothetical protein BBFGKLBO_00635 [Synechococcus sp. CBW1107]
MASSPSAAFLRLRTFIAERMHAVGKALSGNGITRTGNGATSLIGGDALSDGEREALLELCRRQRSASATSSNWSARAGMLSETICQMVSSSRPK